MAVETSPAKVEILVIQVPNNLADRQAILDQLADDRWHLVGVAGRDLYFQRTITR